LTKRFFSRTDGVTGNESYEYDENSKLIEASWQNFDSWLTGVIKFTYDEDGYLSEGYFKGTTGFDASINFEHDDDGNLTKINWDFSFGESQTYVFKYERK